MVRKITGFAIGIFAIAALVFCGNSAKTKDRSPTEVCSLSKVSDTFRKVTPSVIRVTVFKDGRAFMVGTAFFVKTPNGVKVLTAGHLIYTDSGQYYYLGEVITNLRTFKFTSFAMTLNKLDRTDDLALLDFTASTLFFSAKPLEIASQIPMLGEVVLVIGNPNSIFPQYTLGFSSKLTSLSDGGNSYLQLSARVGPGNSGGPVVDCDGRVIGLVLKMAAFPNAFLASYACPSPTLIRFINSK